MARRAYVPVIHVTLAADGRYPIALDANGVGELAEIETQPNRRAADRRARDWIAIYKARPHPVWHEESAS